LQSLEESLGVPLLDRTTKPLRPTSLGQRVYEQSRAVLRELEVLKGMVSVEAPPSGAFRIGVPQFISETILMESVRQLNTTFPDLRIQVTTALSPILIESVENGELDAAAIVLPRSVSAPPGTLAGKAVGDLDMDVVARKGALKRRSHTLQEISELGWILNPRECGFRSGLEDVLASKGLPLHVKLDVFGSEVQLGLVGSGLGLGLLPLQLLRGSPHLRRVQRVEVADLRLRHRVWLVHPPTQGSLSRAVAEFGAVLRKAFSAG
jgi:DNA-binding transcriptional LysR family regulator